MNQSLLRIAGVFVAGVISGIGVGYLLTKKRAEKRADEEIASVREHYKIVRKDGPYSDPGSLAQKYDNIVKENLYSSLIPSREEEVVTEVKEYKEEAENFPEEHIGEYVSETANGFPFDYEEEIPKRTPDHPYVISIDEFENRDDDHPYDQTFITYWGMDRTLADERDEIVDNVDRIVGWDNLSRFGYGSGDPRVVYIRNEQFECDYEVTLDERSYAEVILGILPNRVRPPMTE